MEEKLPAYGGQAVIEGVMMRGSQNVAIAMRGPDHQIVVLTEPLANIYRSKILKMPFVRGVIGLWDALVLGTHALTLSANVQTGEDEKLEGPALYLTLAFSLALGVGVFFLAPAVVGNLSERYLGMNSWFSNLLEGLLRLALLVAYIWGVGFIPDIRRVYAYHGAEHKTINAFESGAEMTPESVAHYPLEHTRCGTAFLLTLVLLSVVVFSLLGPLPMQWRLLSRILMLPVLAGIAYEYIRWTARHIESPVVRWMIKPNLALQRLTTSEPSLEMLEVSIAAFNAMRTRENGLSL
jgi:uncharacterized protein YqhQ